MVLTGVAARRAHALHPCKPTHYENPEQQVKTASYQATHTSYNLYTCKEEVEDPRRFACPSACS